jgi:hypothetical protein
MRWIQDGCNHRLWPFMYAGEVLMACARIDVGWCFQTTFLLARLVVVKVGPFVTPH